MMSAVHYTQDLVRYCYSGRLALNDTRYQHYNLPVLGGKSHRMNQQTTKVELYLQWWLKYICIRNILRTSAIGYD